MFFLGFWFLTNLLSGIGSLAADTGAGGVAWWAHIGGFLVGLLWALPLRRREAGVISDLTMLTMTIAAGEQATYHATQPFPLSTDTYTRYPWLAKGKAWTYGSFGYIQNQ